MLPEIVIDPRFLVTDTGTSDGTQIKYYFEGKWYKVDRYGGEGACEELASKIMELSGLDRCEYVQYDRVVINGEDGCVSDSFLSPGERFFTVYRLHLNTIGTDPAIVTSRMDYDDAIEYIVSFVKEQTGIDIRKYLANTFMLDSLLLNEDRHFNNLGLVYDGTDFRPAPIFDNGKSLFIGNSRYSPEKDIKENKSVAFAKAFSGSFELNRDYLMSYSSFSPDFSKIKKYLRTKDLSSDNIYSRLYKLCNLYSGNKNT